MQTINATSGVQITSTRTTAGLLSQVLWITMAGFIATAAGAYVSPALMGGGSSIGLVILTFGLLFAVNIFARRSPTLALVLFYGFTFLMGIEIGPLLKAYLHLPGGVNIVFQAAATTALGMGIMAAVAAVANFNYQRIGRIAFFAVVGLVLVGFLGFFVHVVNPSLYAWATLGIFSVLLLVDFMRLKNGAMGLAPVQMALSIYLDALNIFMALLQIFGGNGRGRSNRGWS
jgi:FtsH-binding integral membrane protein